MKLVLVFVIIQLFTRNMLRDIIWWTHMWCIFFMVNKKVTLSIEAVDNKQRLTIFDGKLRENRNGSKNIVMHFDIMEVLSQNAPLLVLFINSFLSWPHPVHHCFFIIWRGALPIYPTSASMCSNGSNCDAREARKILRSFHPQGSMDHWSNKFLHSK